MAEKCVPVREVVINAGIELVALGIPWRVARKVVAGVGAAEMRIGPEGEHLGRDRVEAGRGNLRAGERLPGKGIFDRGREQALALGGGRHYHQIALSLALVEVFPTKEEKAPVSHDRT